MKTFLRKFQDLEKAAFISQPFLSSKELGLSKGILSCHREEFLE